MNFIGRVVFIIWYGSSVLHLTGFMQMDIWIAFSVRTNITVSKCIQNMHIYICIYTCVSPLFLPLFSLLLSPILLSVFLFSHCRVQAGLELRIFFLEVPCVGITSKCHPPHHILMHTQTYIYTCTSWTYILQNQNFVIQNDLKAFLFVLLYFSAGGL